MLLLLSGQLEQLRICVLFDKEKCVAHRRHLLPRLPTCWHHGTTLVLLLGRLEDRDVIQGVLEGAGFGCADLVLICFVLHRLICGERYWDRGSLRETCLHLLVCKYLVAIKL